MLVISCTVDFGASGAPILSFVEGEPRVVSVVSAKAESMGRPVSLGADVEGRSTCCSPWPSPGAPETPDAGDPGRMGSGGLGQVLRP
jgi:protease YdgD